MLVESYEIIDGIRKRTAEGDIPEEQARRFQVGDIIRLMRVTTHTQQIGSIPEQGNQDPIPVEQYRITEKFDRVTQTGMPYVELTVVQRFP